MEWNLVEDRLREHFRKEGFSIKVDGDTMACRWGALDINLTKLAMFLARELDGELEKRVEMELEDATENYG